MARAPAGPEDVLSKWSRDLRARLAGPEITRPGTDSRVQKPSSLLERLAEHGGRSIQGYTYESLYNLTRSV